MREYFKGWKRKVGVVTLGLACVFAAGWVRSLYVEDWIMLPIRSSPTVLLSRPSGLALATEDVEIPVKAASQFNWASEPAIDTPSQDPFALLGKVDWRWDFIGFHFCGVQLHEGGPSVSVRWYVIPYWSIVLPLTLLSAWLLLSKPRPAKQANDACTNNPEPAH